MAPFSFSSITEAFLLLMNTPLVPPDSSSAPREVPLTEMPASSRPSRETRRQVSPLCHFLHMSIPTDKPTDGTLVSLPLPRQPQQALRSPRQHPIFPTNDGRILVHPDLMYDRTFVRSIPSDRICLRCRGCLLLIFLKNFLRCLQEVAISPMYTLQMTSMSNDERLELVCKPRTLTAWLRQREQSCTI